MNGDGLTRRTKRFPPNGKLLNAGGTQRYERLDGAVANAAGRLVVKDENPDGPPRAFKSGTEFRSPDGELYRATHDFVIEPAKKVSTRRGPQPVVADAPARIERGATAEVATPGAGRITNARLMAPMASTHLTDTGQRSTALSMTKKAGAVSVTVPEQPTLTPPGQYMLVVVDGRGVPSVACSVEVP